MLIRKIELYEWQRYRVLRLSALSDAPDAFGSTFEAESTRGDDEWRTRAEVAAAARDRVLFVLVDEDDVWHGMAGGYAPGEFPADVDVISMWVSPDLRGQGHGQALLGAVIGWARDRGDRTVGLWVTEGNGAAQRLYARCGFVSDGQRQPLPSNPARQEIRMLLTPTDAGAPR